MRIGVSIALVGLGLLFTCLLSVRLTLADDLPPCNGKTPTGSKDCGEERACPESSSCNGTGVSSIPVLEECSDGSANELCEFQTQTCTQTFHCKKGDDGKCGIDVGNPALDDDQKPIISTASIPTRLCPKTPQTS